MKAAQKASEIFGMDENTWERHANPWSVYSRTSVYPILILSIWSRIWIGWWCLIPIALSLIWMFLNPRLFGKPGSTQNWASKAVLGERVLINKEGISIPHHHQVTTRILNSLGAVSTVIMIIGLVELHYWLTGIGVGLQIIFKYWYLDRMVWLFEDLKNESSVFLKWIY